MAGGARAVSEAPAIGFDYRGSRMLIATTLALAALAVVAIWISGAPPWLRWLSIPLVGACAGVAWGRLLRPRVRTLLWRADGGVELALNDTIVDGAREAIGAVEGGRIMGPLIVLTLRWPRRGRAALWLLPDNLDPDTRRRLRVRLGAHVGAGASGNADRR